MGMVLRGLRRAVRSRLEIGAFLFKGSFRARILYHNESVCRGMWICLGGNGQCITAIIDAQGTARGHLTRLSPTHRIEKERKHNVRDITGGKKKLSPTTRKHSGL